MQLNQNQTKILEHLQSLSQGATADDLIHVLNITKTAVKEHLNKLVHQGFINFEDSKGFIGRPKRYYKLTDEGVHVFPKQYSWLSNIVLEQLSSEMGPKGVQKFMKNLADAISKDHQNEFDKITSSTESLKKITALLSELGYRASLKQSDLRKGAIIEATNCVYHNVAKKHPELCSFDIRLIENLSNLDVKLESCIARGGELCRFCLRHK
ncbi:MAG: helix-turn-helix transcriptional regulator [Pseudobdellovibrio sp.]